MKQIQLNIDRYTKPAKAKDERSELIGFFTDKVNETRTGKYKPLSYRAIAVKLGHLKLPDLYYLKSTCEKAQHFAKTFWWSIKPDNAKN